MRIQHNIMAMNAYRNYTNNASSLSKNLEKLSSGYKINRAGDDAAGLAISEKMRAQITGLNAAQKNVKDGISLVKTGEGAMQEIHDMLNRMDYLATQSANGTYDNEVDRANLQKEVESLKSEINRIADSANFNGIKLLDGSLAGKGATSVKVKGVDYTIVDAVAGQITNDKALKNANALKDGDSVTFSVGMSDGTSVDVTLTARYDPNDVNHKKGQLVGEDGTVYDTIDDLAGKGFKHNEQPTNGSVGVQAAMLKALKGNETLSSQFKITGTDGQYTFETIEAGKTGVTQINSLGWQSLTVDGVDNGHSTGENPVVQASDKGYGIKAADITLYNGKNYDDAVFTVNGKKFVVVTPDNAGTNLGRDSQNMNATYGLGADVTVLVADTGKKGLQADDANFKQNLALMKEVTGLDIRASAAADLSANAGIVISTSGTKGGLTLQIGDTADSYNQMNVAIGDMHTKAMGIDGISIADQTSAASAVDKIKSAINYVSSVRGDLGAIQNRLEHTQNNLSVMAENIQDAESTIRDTDVAEEMMSYVKNNILVQSAQAMLAQANQVPQGVLQLLG